jgi:hypothetical protein
MKKRLLLGILFFLTLSHLLDWGPFNLLVTVYAQATQVTGQVKDVNGLPYAGAQMKAQLVFAGPPVSNPTVTISVLSQCRANGFGSAPCQVPFTPSNGPFNLDGAGNIPGGGITLQDNTQVTPSGTQWAFSVNTPGNPPPLGTGPQVCAATLTISGASQGITASFSGCPALSNIGSGAGAGGAATNTISSNCPAGATLPPCIAIPGVSGGCFLGAVTTASNPTISFQSGFPGGIQVGMTAWVTLNHGSAAIGSCPGFDNSAPFATATNDCGQHSTSPPLTIVSIVPGSTITLSGNCQTGQAGTNAWLYYGWNIFSQMQTACNGVASVAIQDGTWVFDNSAAVPAGSAGCGTNGVGGTLGTGMVFANQAANLLVAPWTNGVGDTGVVFHGNQLKNISIVNDWTNNTVTHGTPWFANSCNSSNVKIVGWNVGVNGAAEAVYPSQGLNPIFNQCVFDNSYISTNSTGVSVGGNNGSYTLRDMAINTASSAILNQNNGAFNNTIRIKGGYFFSIGATHGDNSNGSTLDSGFNTASGDLYEIENATFCNGGASSSAIRDLDSTGEIRIVSSKINSGCFQSLGTNTSGITLTSGETLRISQTDVGANGTGNTINNPTGATVFDNCGNSVPSAGAGYTGGGTYDGPCYAFGPSPASGNIALGAGFATSSASAFVPSAVDGRRHFTFTITLAGAPALANETITYTFPAPFVTAPGTCRASVIGGTQFAAAAYSFLTTTLPTTTSVVFTQQTAAGTAGNTEIIAVDCQ